jgi:RNA polymerase sigma factor for flagellar operon FliA
LAGVIADRSQPHPADTIEQNEMCTLLTEAVRRLPQTEKLVLDLYFRQELTLAEIGRVLGLHLTRVSQIKTQAVLRLRSWFEARMTVRRAPREG